MLKKIMFSIFAILMTYWMAIDQEALAVNCENPDSLTFAMVPTEETVAELELYKPVTDRMAKLTGKKISFFMPTSYASVVEGLESFRRCRRVGSIYLCYRKLERLNRRSLCYLCQETRTHARRGARISWCFDFQEGY